MAKKEWKKVQRGGSTTSLLASLEEYEQSGVVPEREEVKEQVYEEPAPAPKQKKYETPIIEDDYIDDHYDTRDILNGRFELPVAPKKNKDKSKRPLIPDGCKRTKGEIFEDDFDDDRAEELYGSIGMWDEPKTRLTEGSVVSSPTGQQFMYVGGKLIPIEIPPTEEKPEQKIVEEYVPKYEEPPIVKATNTTPFAESSMNIDDPVPSSSAFMTDFGLDDFDEGAEEEEDEKTEGDDDNHFLIQSMTGTKGNVSYLFIGDQTVDFTVSNVYADTFKINEEALKQFMSKVGCTYEQLACLIIKHIIMTRYPAVLTNNIPEFEQFVGLYEQIPKLYYPMAKFDIFRIIWVADEEFPNDLYDAAHNYADAGFDSPEFIKYLLVVLSVSMDLNNVWIPTMQTEVDTEISKDVEQIIASHPQTKVLPYDAPRNTVRTDIADFESMIIPLRAELRSLLISIDDDYDEDDDDVVDVENVAQAPAPQYDPVKMAVEARESSRAEVKETPKVTVTPSESTYDPDEFVVPVKRRDET